MKRQNKIRRFWIVVGIILAAELAVLSLLNRHHGTDHPLEVSETYKRYADTDGMNVAFIKDFRINDTLCVDVTLIEAADSNGWNRLMEDFSLQKQLPPEYEKRMAAGQDLVWWKLFPKAEEEKNRCEMENNLAVISYKMRAVSVFHVKTKDEYHAVIFYNFMNNFNESNK